MAVFMLVMKKAEVSIAEDELLTSQLHEKFGSPNVFKIVVGQYMVSSDSFFMPKDVASHIGEDFAKGMNGSYIIVPVQAYWGFNDNALWSWLAEKVV